MIKMLISNTAEVDDPEAALDDIFSQLSLDGSLGKNSLGIIHCSHEFIVSGVAEAVCKRLPFPSLGMNTFFHSTSLGISGGQLLSLCVLTSDEIDFKLSLSEPIEPVGARTTLVDAFSQALDMVRDKPSLCFALSIPRFDFPFGETTVEAFDEVMRTVPIFGAFAADYTTDLRAPMILCNGVPYHDRMAVVLLEGRKIRPRFRIFSAPDNRIINQKAIVTESDGNVVKRVNGKPALEFLDSLGLCSDGRISGNHTFPVFVDRHDGARPRARGIINQTPEGYIVLSGKAPEDSTLGIGAMDTKEIMRDIRRVSKLVRALGPNALLQYSCVTRNFVLGLNYRDEVEAADEFLEGYIPYLFAYSFGEICPYIGGDGKMRNEFHNMALVTAGF
jgi:hypothetical protein